MVYFAPDPSAPFTFYSISLADSIDDEVLFLSPYPPTPLSPRKGGQGFGGCRPCDLAWGFAPNPFIGFWGLKSGAFENQP